MSRPNCACEECAPTKLVTVINGISVEEVRQRITAGYDLEALGDHGQTALYEVVHYALRGDETATAKLKLLIDAGANIDAADAYGNRPVMAATIEHAVMLIKAGANPAGWYWCQRTTDDMAALLDAGLDINMRIEHGRTALHVLALRYYATQRYWEDPLSDLIGFLVARGANIFLRDDYGKMAFAYAQLPILDPRPAIITLLLSVRPSCRNLMLEAGWHILEPYAE